MLSDPFLDNLGDVLQTGGKLFLFVMTQGDVVSNLTVITNGIHGVLELESRFLELALLVQNAGVIHYDVRVLLVGLSEQGLGMLYLVLLISNQ